MSALVWKLALFEKMEGSDFDYSCKECGEVIKLSGRSPSSLTRHARTHQQYAKVLDELEAKLKANQNSMDKFVKILPKLFSSYKPLKEKIRHYYNIWMSNGDRQEFTAAGNLKAPALEVVLELVHRAWEDFSKDMIIKSFKACALTTPTDGSGDDKIACFKPEGSIGPIGLELLRNIRAEQRAEDGRNDEEEAGISDEEMDLENVVDDEALLFDV